MTSLADKILEKPTAALVAQEVLDKLKTEKERRIAFYNWIDDSMKAEFINGEVIIHSPAKNSHLHASDLLSRLMSYYVSHNDLGVIRVEKAMIALTRNDYEPDICFFRKEIADTFTDEQVLFPAPDLVIEILSKRTAKKDKTIKFEDYAAHNIAEYWIIDPNKQVVEQFALIGGLTSYSPISTNYYDDVISSRVIKGFEIPVASIFDVNENLKALREIISK